MVNLSPTQLFGLTCGVQGWPLTGVVAVFVAVFVAVAVEFAPGQVGT